MARLIMSRIANKERSLNKLNMNSVNIMNTRVINFMKKHDIVVYADSIWKYNSKNRAWNIIWPKNN